jgi:hypothetical protein
MTATTPARGTQRARTHEELLHGMLAHARARFSDAGRAWDPGRPGVDLLPDHGRGLLDVYALALHVLWTYQEAWADEAFLATARLTESGERLLELVGLRPDPGAAATGLQAVRCRQGEEGTIPEGFAVRSRASAGHPAQTYETLRPRRVSWRLNEVRPFLPPGAVPAPAPGAVAAVVEPRPGASTQGASPFPPASTAGALTDRLRAARLGSDAQRRAAQARQTALRLADLAREIAGDAAGCTATFSAVCARLTEAAHAGALAPPAPGPLSESQETLVGILARLAARESPALAALDAALGRTAEEDDAAYTGRLDQAAVFLDSLVAGLLQHARDQVVLLHGAEALRRVDAARPGRPAPAGVAAPGCDTLYLQPDDAGTHDAVLAPGDWLVLGEERTGPGADAVTVRTHHEAVQVVRLRVEVPEGHTRAMTQVTFRPPLRRRYDLASAVVLGNVLQVSHGATVREELVADGGGLVRPTSGPLTWLRDPSPLAEDGRLPAVVLEALGREWERVADLAGAGPGGAVHTVETEPGRQVRLRVGDGREGAALPAGTPVVLRYRVGVGSLGDQPPGAVTQLVGEHPAVLDTENPLPLTGGTDPEGLERTKARARGGLHALRRAVSAADVAALASTFGGIRAAAVLRGATGRRRALTVVVCAETGEATTAAELAEVRAFLEARTPPGTAVTVVDRGVVPVRARLRLVVAPGGDPLAVLRAAHERLGEAPAAPPGLLDPGVSPLGRDLAASDLYRALDGVPDLAGAVVDALARADAPAGAAADPRGPVRVGAGEIALWAPTGTGTEALELSWSEEVDR